MKKTSHPLYSTWRSMRARCKYPSQNNYYLYGGRGVKVCPSWDKSFKSFVEDMGDKPSPKHQLDRIDNDGDYSPENCRWVTSSDNSKNRRSNHIITYKGETKTISEWAEGLGIKGFSLTRRLRKWPLEKAMNTPKYTSKDSHKKSNL